MLSDLEKRVILALQRDLEITPDPFRELAAQLETPEAEVLAVIRRLMETGYIRRFGATLRHQQSGFAANALVAWAIPGDRITEIGKKMAAYREVSHCYFRKPANPAASWPYNLYTMVHGRTPEDCILTAARMAAATGMDTYEMLFSETELKKTTMRYFREERGE